MKHVLLVVLSVLCAVIITVAVALPALAHDGPAGDEWVMADWMFITFAVFAGGALIAFVACLKAGLLSNIEEAKYQILTIDEPDYYSS
jgi:energy-converting hydrogenase Eha subunit A